LAALKLLQNQYKQLKDDPVEGFLCVPYEDNFFHWSVYIEGPRDTIFEGGIFELEMDFPKDYPMMPPSLNFVSEFWHPNVYPDGKVCISILHPPGEDEMSNELPGERWMPSQTVTTIILSVISMLGDPNFSSPANVDASVEWRKKFSEYKLKVRGLVDKALKRNSHIKIPHPESNPEERRKYLEKQRILNEDFDFYDGFVNDDNVDFDFGSGEDEFGVFGSDKESENNSDFDEQQMDGNENPEEEDFDDNEFKVEEKIKEKSSPKDYQD